MKLSLTSPQLAKLMMDDSEVQLELNKATKHILGKDAIENQVKKAIQSMSDVKQLVRDAVMDDRAWHGPQLRGDIKTQIDEHMNEKIKTYVEKSLTEYSKKLLTKQFRQTLINALEPELDDYITRRTKVHAKEACEEVLKKKLGM